MSAPHPTPEGDLIKKALKRTRLSARKAAAEAGISEGRWRQIMSGYQTVSRGQRIPVRGPAETVARMARVAGVPPEDLERVGREDAAEELRQMSATDLDTVTSGVSPAQVRAIMAILDTLPSLSEREEVLKKAAAEIRRGGTVEDSTDRRAAM